MSKYSVNSRISGGDENSEDGSFYDAIGHHKEEEDYFFTRPISPFNTEPIRKVDDTPYVRLENFAGLSSPDNQDHEENSKGSIDNEDDKISPRDGSLISSLTSFSEHHQAVEQLSGRESPPLDFDPLRSSPVHPYNLRADMISSSTTPDSKNVSRQFEQDVLKVYKNTFIRTSQSDDVRPTSPVFSSPSKSKPSASSSSSTYMKWNSSCASQDPILSTMSTKLSQVLSHHIGPVWIAKFSPDGKYLCTAGQDTRALVWIVGLIPSLSSHSSSISHHHRYDEHDDSQSHDSKEEMMIYQTQHQNDLIVHPEPYRIFEGHTADIVDIAWSKSNFILTASLDKTVSLWLVSSSERIQFFRHPDIVTSVDFHPIHDRYFISGCFDRRLRFWDILPDGHVRAWAQTPETITSVSFDPSGNTIVGGLLNGQVYFYTFDMKYITQINCRNSSGSYRGGRKVTGINFIKKDTSSTTSNHHHMNSIDDPITSTYRPKVGTSREKLIITTNDHRIRLLQTENYSLVSKYLGLKNSSMQIKASLNDDGRYIISGSEDGRIYCWMVNHTPKQSWMSIFSKHNKHTNQFYEYIDSTGSNDVAITSAIFAPATTSYHLLASSYHHHKNQLRMRDVSEYYVIDKLKNKIDPILIANNMDTTDLSIRVMVAADYEGKVRVYVNQSYQ